MSALHGAAQLPPPAVRFPDFFLLETEASIRDLRNETTAAALTRAGLTVQVSFAVADPPRLSTCCVCCPNRGESPFAYTPEIISSAEDTVLIRVALSTEESPQYFLYRARGPNGGPSLHLLPDIREYSSAERLLEPPLAFVTSHDNQFVMAALSFGAGRDGQYYYNLHTISSEPRSTWSNKLLNVEIPDGLAKKSALINPTKVIALGGGLLGWVDLKKGIVICNVLDPAATTARFVPMPKLLPINNELYWDQYSVRPVRDVTFSRGIIKCVELEQLLKLRATPVPVVPDPWDMPELDDSELAICPPQEEEEVYDVVGWRLITWCRALDWKGWRRGNLVHSDDLIENVSLPQPGGGALNVPFKNLKAASPTLCGDDDVVYLMSMLHEDDEVAWIVPVDTTRKSVGEVMLSPAKGSSIYHPTFIPCALSKYLDPKSDGAQAGKRNASHVPPSPNLNKSKKQRLSELEPPPPAPAASNSGVPGWGLVNSTTFIRDLLNETTAGTLTRAGLAIQVSFVFADSPRLSYFCVHRPNSSKATPFASAPTVVCSVEDTALIRVVLTTEKSPQYFLYRARGPYGGPSLHLLPNIYEYSRAEFLMQPPLAFVSHDNKQFVMAALSYKNLRAVDDGKHYYLHTISSEPGSTWCKKLLEVQIPDCFTAKSAAIYPTKVIALGHGLIGWVDLLKGIVICNVLNSAAVTKAYFVPTPNLLPRNNELYSSDPYSARRIRDVTFSGGYIKCVEFEELVQVRAKPAPAVRDPWNMPELHDFQLAISPPQEEEEVYDVVGWRLITWYRAPGWGGWRRGNMVHSDDLGTLSLPQQLEGGALNVPFKKLKTASPTLCGDDDVVYLVSMLHEDDEVAWIVPVDTKRKSVGEVMLSPAEWSSIYHPTFLPCALTKYLDAKSDGDQAGKRNTSHVPPSPNINKSKKQRHQLSQAGLEEQQPESQLLQHSSCSR